MGLIRCQLSARTAVRWLGARATGLLMTELSFDLHGPSDLHRPLGFGLFRPGFTAGASLSVPRATRAASRA